MHSPSLLVLWYRRVWDHKFLDCAPDGDGKSVQPACWINPLELDWITSVAQNFLTFLSLNSWLNSSSSLLSFALFVENRDSVFASASLAFAGDGDVRSEVASTDCRKVSFFDWLALLISPTNGELCRRVIDLSSSVVPVNTQPKMERRRLRSSL